MYQLERRFYTELPGQPKRRVGNIFPASDIQRRIQLVPKFGEKALHRGLTEKNSMDLIDVFYWNNFEAKETFHTSLSYL
jgi:hypothetical protein